MATRSSPLALRQAGLAAEKIQQATREKVEIVPLSSLGDEDQVRPLARFLQPGAFTGRLDEALQRGEADLAVHSLKDVPLRPADGLTRTFVVERADPADLLATMREGPLGTLAGIRTGTSAPRRQSQLAAYYPDAIAVDVRGSIGTRLQRVADGDLDALLVAAAALQRGTDPLPADIRLHRLPLHSWPTAPGQGALALQAREGSEGHRILEHIEDTEAARGVAAERGLLSDLGGGCGTPLGATCLPPGHHEGDAGSWALHVTFPGAGASPPDLRRFTILDEDPERCRKQAFERLRSPESEAPPQPQVSPAKGTILLVMDPATSTEWRDRLRAAGYRAVHWWPFHTVDLVATDDRLMRRLEQTFEAADWILVTSARAVPLCKHLHAATGALPRFAVIGPATARAVRAAGLQVNAVAAGGHGSELARIVARHAARDGGRKVLWPSGAEVTPATAQALAELDLEVTQVPVYRLETRPTALPDQGGDIVLFTSPKTARHALSLLHDTRPRRCFAIGPTTAAALAASDVDVTSLSAPTPTALLECLSSG